MESSPGPSTSSEPQAETPAAAPEPTAPSVVAPGPNIAPTLSPRSGMGMLWGWKGGLRVSWQAGVIVRLE